MKWETYEELIHKLEEFRSIEQNEKSDLLPEHLEIAPKFNLIYLTILGY